MYIHGRDIETCLSMTYTDFRVQVKYEEGKLGKRLGRSRALGVTLTVYLDISVRIF